MSLSASEPSLRTWRPLWPEGAPPEAEGALEAIVEAVASASERSDLAGGAAGQALLHGYLELARPGRGHRERALALLDAAIEGVGAKIMGPGFYAGFTGIAWTVDHLRSRLDLDLGADANDAIDEALLTYLEASPWAADYDLISGLVGLGVYALERLDGAAGRAIAERVLTHLEALKVPFEPGWTWATPPELLPPWQRERSPEGYYNLGLAHGMPGILALLGHLHARGFEPERCLSLLEGGVRWLLAQRKPEGFGSAFTAWNPIGEGPREGPTRLSWCYGDLGLSLALLVAARGAGREDWEAEALALARAAAGRKPPEGAQDACLCHGFAGNAHLFNRLWQATREDAFAEAARAWMSATLAARRPGQGIAGYRAWMPGVEGEDPWRDEAGLLEGAVGIGLALAAALDPVAPAWDRMLLVDVPDLKGAADQR